MNSIRTAGRQTPDASGSHRSGPKGTAPPRVKGCYGSAAKLTLNQHSYGLVATLCDHFGLGGHLSPLNPKMVGWCKLQTIRPPSPLGWRWP